VTAHPILRSSATRERHARDTITSRAAFGAANAGMHGACPCCAMSPRKEHLGCPTKKTSSKGVIAYKIAGPTPPNVDKRAGAQKTADGRPFSCPMFRFDWKEQFRPFRSTGNGPAIPPTKTLRRDTFKSAHFCRMLVAEVLARLKITAQEIREMRQGPNSSSNPHELNFAGELS